MALCMCLICACSSKKERAVTNEANNVGETENEWKEYQDALEFNAWTIFGQVMTEEEVPVVLASKDSALMQFSVDAFNYDPNYFVYIYINDTLVDKVQYSNVSATLDITEEFLQENDYVIRFIQYDNNSEDGNIISEKIARYKVEWE